VENGPYGFFPIPCSSYDVKVLAQLLAKFREDVFTVIRKQYPDRRHKSPLTGQVALIGASVL
jgi:putative lipoic acid-binding regulatory protein